MNNDDFDGVDDGGTMAIHTYEDDDYEIIAMR